MGLDPYVWFMHADQPGRHLLALDLMEGLRPVVADRFVLSAVNNRVVQPGRFERRESGEARLTDEGGGRIVRCVAEAEEGGDRAFVPEGEDSSRTCSSCAGASACALYSGRFGRLSAVSVEVRLGEMLTVVTYDVSTEDPTGQRRPRKVARHCVNYDQRV
nr:CRISPR-associated endonuclease Cas2 [Gordonibacter sp. An230]